MNQNKIGLFGGSFDPIHNGHFNAAMNLNRFLNLDRFIFIPTFCAPHKRDKYQSMVNHRYQMILEATKEFDFGDPSKLSQIQISLMFKIMKDFKLHFEAQKFFLKSNFILNQ